MLWVPNFLTISNAFFGCIALIFIKDLQLEYITICIGAALICDLFDGYLARKLKVNGDLGIQLDSLADMISFGLLPGALMAKIGFSLSSPIFFLGFFITLGSLYRLARFNISKTISDDFVGLPTPANTLMILGMAWGVNEFEIFKDQENQNSIWSIFSIAFSLIIIMSVYVMNSSLHVISLKSRPTDWKSMTLRLSFVIISIVLLIIFKMAAFTFIIPLLVLFSAIERKLY
ncbi:MAG: Uncharacterised protein [Owenweeksia sp. TMED14]|nr:MAG: Uncharacterised protein [Owenweeksia sp. TMED14]